ncbi:hypothetical protein [Spirosoma foliorum]|uniref:Uncharacterized protein n=1 Tax=Spirosoma foliorum TaxID=2710596 RepID=A0A7G5GNB8_9BACT|nr:hypothetical protein [Spirosoma foliorum]QMW00360.1 hypothetical protein H3H32_20330 [Spirosoma foliorum]
MTFWKLLTYINWLLIAVWAAMMLYYLTLPNSPTDAAGQGAESAIKGMCAVVLLVLIGLNRLPYHWTKAFTFLLGILVLWMVRYITMN